MTSRFPERMNYSQILEIASCTDPGMVRSHNEDSIASDPANGLVVLADGMGGYNAGEVASGMATTVITTEMQQLLAKVQPYEIDEETKAPVAGRMIREQVLKANTSIYQAAQSQPQYAGMGTTLVVCLFYDNKMTGRRTSATRACTCCATASSRRSRATIRCCRSRSTAASSPPSRRSTRSTRTW